MTRASTRKHVLAAGMLAVLLALTVSTGIAFRESDRTATGSDGKAVANAPTPPPDSVFPRRPDSLDLREMVEPTGAADQGTFTGTINGLRIEPHLPKPSIVATYRCPNGDLMVAVVGADAARVAAQDKSGGFDFEERVAGTVSFSRVLHCDGELRHAAAHAVSFHDGRTRFFIHRDVISGYVTERVDRRNWHPLEIGNARGAYIDPFLTTVLVDLSRPMGSVPRDLDGEPIAVEGCYAAARDEATGMLTTVSARNATPAQCIGILTDIVGGE